MESIVLVEGCLSLWRVIDKTTNNASSTILNPVFSQCTVADEINKDTSNVLQDGMNLFPESQCKITPSAFQSLRQYVFSGVIAFAQTLAGWSFLLLLLNTFKGLITSLEVTQGTLLINGLLPELGGLPPLASRLWRIAMEFPDYVPGLAQALPSSLLSADVTYASLDPGTKAIIDDMLSLRQKDGKIYIQDSKLFALTQGDIGESACRSLIETMYGKGLELREFEPFDQSKGKSCNTIRLVSRTDSATCPVCGKRTTMRAQGGPREKPRVFWDVPLSPFVPTSVEIYGVKKYVCTDPNCGQSGFAEQFSCIQPMKRMTKRLNSLILAINMLTSFHGEESLLGLCGISVSDSTIRRQLLNLQFPDDSDVTEIGIDDIAYRKGMTYLTVIYELKTHRLLDIVEGRDGKELKKWLDKHPKVSLICRDRGTAYSATIDEWAAEHDCIVIEIADRFHLNQNCIENLKVHCSALLPSRFAIVFKDTVAEVIVKDIPNKVAMAKVPKPEQSEIDLFRKWYDNSPWFCGSRITLDLSSDEVNQEEGFKIDDASESIDPPVDAAPPPSGEKEETTRTPAIETKVHSAEKEKRERLYNLICTIRSRIDPNRPRKAQYEELATEYNLTPTKVGQYVRMSESELRAIKGPLTPEEEAAETSALQQKRNEDYRIACEVHAEFDPKGQRKPQYEELAKKHGISVQLARKYCLMSNEDLEAIRNPQLAPPPKPKKPRKPRHKEIDNYKYIIYKMLVDDRDIGKIFWFIKDLGCSLADESLIKSILQIHGIIYPNVRMPSAKDFIDLRYPEGVYVFSRCELLKYITTVNPKTKKNPVLDQYADLIFASFPSVATVRTIFTDFHSAIMGDDPVAVDRFIDKYKDGYLKGFCRSLNHDLEAIHNAVKYTYSSGFVEGGNNKIKYLKRASFGRLRLPTLRLKCMYAFMHKIDDFKLTDVAPWLG